VVNRFGVTAGPWQLGRIDQGVFTHWLLSHQLCRPLNYIRFDGSGLQFRDLIHIDDGVDLFDDQLERPEHWDGFVGNVGCSRTPSAVSRSTSRRSSHRCERP